MRGRGRGRAPWKEALGLEGQDHALLGLAYHLYKRFAFNTGPRTATLVRGEQGRALLPPGRRGHAAEEEAGRRAVAGVLQ